VIKGVESLAYPSRLQSQKWRETSLRAAGERVPTEPVDWASVEADLEFVRRTKANLLVIGHECLVMHVIRRFIDDVPASIVNPSDVRLLALSNQWPPPGTLVFRDIHLLDDDGQTLLFDWLETASGGRQIVSTASECLLPLVNAGAFDSGLYYRLNTVSIRLGQ
jgi:Sigma-54 interaction domain